MLWTSKNGTFFKSSKSLRFCNPKCRNVWWNAQGKNKETIIETMLAAEFEVAGLKPKRNVPLLGITYPDFYFPDDRIVVYADGHYWHNKPGVKEKDRKQVKTLSANGFKVFRFSEEQIMKSTKACVMKIQGVMALAARWKEKGL